MEKLKKCDIIIQPTNNPSIFRLDERGKMIWGDEDFPYILESYDKQHLHLISDDKIEIGETYYCSVRQSVLVLEYDVEREDTDRKLIATTDRRLIRCACELGHPCDDRDCIPKLSDETIETYIKDGVNEVSVRYRKVTHDYGSGIKAVSKKWWLKLTDKREVITQPIKQKTYTQDEVIAMLTKERERGIEITNAFNSKYTSKANDYLEGDGSLKYIAEREAEVCRKIEITIDGRTLGLEPHLHNQIKNEYFNHDT